MSTLALYINSLSDPDARAALHACCASSAWIEGMLRARPFNNDDEVRAAADRIWTALSPKDWLEAFDAHPRIGERAAAAHAAAAWSRAEQSGMNAASGDTARALAEGNKRYEQKFGHVFLICATGKSADEMLAALHARLDNDPAAELRVAAAELAKITRIRLAKLLIQ